jgi:hypothetical protein
MDKELIELAKSVCMKDNMKPYEYDESEVKTYNNEPNLKMWEHSGLNCCIVRNMYSGVLLGYVGVPPTHPAYGVNYMDAEYVKVHGGLTYSAEHEGLWWFGFDCNHFGDYAPFNEFASYDKGEYRNMNYVTEQCNNLAEQLCMQNINI